MTRMSAGEQEKRFGDLVMRILVGRRLGGALILAVGMFLLAGYPSALAQTKDKPAPKEEEEAPAKPQGAAAKGWMKKNGPPSRVAGKQVLRVGDEDAEAAAPKTGFDLSKEAGKTSNRYVKGLFSSLSPPHDLLTMKDGKTVRLNPVPRFFPPDSKEFIGLTVTPHDAQGKRSTPLRLDSQNAQRVQGFEQVVLDKVNDFLKSEPEKEPPGSKDFMSRLDMLREAEKALVAGILYYRSAKETGKREGAGWIGAERALEMRLIDVQAQQVRILTNTKNWQAAFALETHLANVYSGQGKIVEPLNVEFIHLLASHASSAIESGEYATAIKRLRVLQERFPGAAAEINGLREELNKYAKAQLIEADKLTKEGKKTEAMAKLPQRQRYRPRAARAARPGRQAERSVFRSLRGSPCLAHVPVASAGKNGSRAPGSRAIVRGSGRSYATLPRRRTLRARAFRGAAAHRPPGPAVHAAPQCQVVGRQKRVHSRRRQAYTAPAYDWSR